MYQKMQLQKNQNFHTVYWTKWILHVMYILWKDSEENIAIPIFNLSFEY